jgi:hypothetical protein
MNIRKVYRTTLLGKLEVLVEFKPMAYEMMEWERQEPANMVPLIARNITKQWGPWSKGKDEMLDVDTLGAPYIDGADPLSAGRLWITSEA